MLPSVPSFARAALIAVAVALELAVTYLLVAAPPANLAALLGSIGGMASVAMHLLASILLAAGFGGFLPGGSVADRASVVVLYFLLAFILPGAGLAGVVLLAAILARGGKQVEGEAEFVIGNPLLENVSRRGEAPAAPHLEPLAIALRSLDTPAVRRAMLALRNRAENPAAAAILKRFRGDLDSEVQFFAQSALSGAVDRAEARATAFAARIARAPDDIDAIVGLAEGLLATASGQAAAADRRRIASEALGHLESAREGRPTSARLARLIARAHLLMDDAKAAGAALSGIEDLSGESLEVLFRDGDWAGLRSIAESGEVACPELRKALAFWSDKGGEAAA